MDNKEVIKGAAKRLASKVLHMRQAQQAYLKESPHSASKASKLAMANRLEREVDEIIKSFNQTIDKL